MRPIWSFQNPVWKGITHFQHNELALRNLQHYGWQDLGLEIKNRSLVSDSSLIRLSSLNGARYKVPDPHWNKYFHSALPINCQHIRYSQISVSKPSLVRHSNLPLFVRCNVRWCWTWWMLVGCEYLDAQKWNRQKVTPRRVQNQIFALYDGCILILCWLDL